MKTPWRFLSAAALLGGTALFLQAHNKDEIIPARVALASFPQTLGNWTGSDIPISQDVRNVLGPGDFLLRDYWNRSDNAAVALFIAYFPSQRAGDTIHSPKNCLPGAGWWPIRGDRILINIPGHAPFRANRYLIAKGEDRQLVLYWYLAHNRAVASEYAAKLYLVTDSIRTHRSDGSLIRLSTGLSSDQDVDAAQQLLVSFAGDVVSKIDAYVPR
jgi:EpsI family protein